MKTFQLLLAFLGAFVGCMSAAFAQKTTYIDLRREPMQVQPQSFYIAGVFDARLNKSSIGEHINSTPEKVHKYDLRGGVDSAIYRLLYWTLPRDTSKIPVYLEINHLMVVEQPGNRQLQQRVELLVSFYKDLDGERSLLYRSIQLLEEEGSYSMQGTIEKRIRLCLQQALKRFNESSWGADANGMRFKDLPTQTDSLRAQYFGWRPTPSALSQQKQLNNSRKRATVMLTGFHQQALLTSGWGGSALLFYGKPTAKFKLGAHFSIERLTFRPGALSNQRNRPVSLGYITPGMVLLSHLNRSTHLTFNVYVPFGQEVFTTNGLLRSQNILGVNTGIGFMWLVPHEASPVLGFRIFQQYTNSALYPFEFGAQLQLGIKF